MSNILFKMYHNVIISNLAAEQQKFNREQALQEDKRDVNMKLGERNFEQSTDNEYQYSYKGNIDPYGLNNYFSNKKNQNITIFVGDTNLEKVAPTVYNANVSKNLVYTENGDGLLIKSGGKISKNKYKVNLNYIKYVKSNQVITNKDARLVNAQKIAARLGKTNIASVANPDSGGIYQPTKAEMISLMHMLKNEIGSIAGDGIIRTERMWQREKALILWCYINAVWKGFGSKKDAITNSIIQLIPDRPETNFQGYISSPDNNLYRDMNLEGNASRVSEDKFNDSNYNFELFIDAFFHGYFPEEAEGYTNWSHRKALTYYNPTHLPSNFNITDIYDSDNNKMTVTKSFDKALTLDGNIIITKGAGAYRGSIANNDNK